MTPVEFLSSIRADSNRMAMIAAASIDARVPFCPKWDLADLITHVGWVHSYLAYLAGLPDAGAPTPEITAIARQRMRGLERPNTDLVPWFRDGVDTLLQALDEARPTKTLHTFYGVHGPSLLMRRAATETTVHRWDAEDAMGTPGSLNPALSAEGIDEFLEVLVPRFFMHSEFAGTGQIIQLETMGGGDDHWTITVNDDTTKWHRGLDGIEVDVKVRGSLSDLYLFFWGRPPAEPLDVTGDRDLLTRWQAALAF